jgi:nitrous oxidase accessory protein NosD
MRYIRAFLCLVLAASLTAGWGGGGGGVDRESALAAGGSCKAKNERTGEQYKQTANPLGDAITAAQGGDTIRIWGVCVGGFVSDKSLTLQGQGAKATLDGGGGWPGGVLTIQGDVTVSINDLTIANGFAIAGGGIHNGYLGNGNVTLTNSTVSGNYSSGGGGIFNGGMMTLN